MLASFMLSTALEKSSRVLRAMGPWTYSGCTGFSGLSGFWELRVSGRRIRSLIAFLREEKARRLIQYIIGVCVSVAQEAYNISSSSNTQPLNFLGSHILVII